MSQGQYVAAAYARRPRVRAHVGRDHRDQAGPARAGDGRARGARARAADLMAEFLVWPALIAYGEAAVAYAGFFRGRGDPARLAIWGVRIGWLAQTGLLIVQALDSDGFPWGTWAGALNLFVWLVVGAYLIWGCSAALPAARPRRDAARGGAARRRLGGWRYRGRDRGQRRRQPRGACRAHARGVRRPHARSRSRRPLPLAGTTAQAT